MAVGKYSIELETNLAEVEKKLNSTKASLSDLEKKKIKLEVDVSRFNDLQKKAKDIALQIKQLRQDKAVIKAEMQGFQEASRKVSEIDKTIEKLNQKKASIKADANVTDASTKLADIDSEIKKLNAEKAVLEVDANKIDGAKEKINGLDSDIRGLNQQAIDVRAEINGLSGVKGELSDVKRQINEINAQKIDIKFSDSLKNAGSQIKGIGDKMMSAVSPLSSKMSNALGIGAAVKGVDMAMNKITGSISGAVSRIDTLNNFPKVMSNMNIGAKDAEQAINKVSEGIKGLPTSLDEGAAAVQRFTSKNEDVNKSADIFLALNDALVAGGQSGEIQASAMEQISQAYSKGKPDMVEWKSLAMAMPAQIKQIAKAMDFDNEDALGEALRSGELSMDEFMAKIVELDQKGGAGFKSFSEQARNAAGGLQTGWKNLELAIQCGVAGIITSIDTMFKKIGQGGIGDVLSNIGTSFEKALSYVGSTIEQHADDIKGLFDSIGDAVKEINFKAIFDGFVSGLVGLSKVIAGTMKGQFRLRQHVSSSPWMMFVWC